MWNAEEGQFVEAPPITETSRKHVTAELDDRIAEATDEAELADEAESADEAQSQP